MSQISVNQQQWEQAFHSLGWNTPLPEQTWNKLGGGPGQNLDWATVHGLISSIGWSEKHAETLWLKIQEITATATPAAPMTIAEPLLGAPPAPPLHQPSADPWNAPQPSVPADPWGAQPSVSTPAPQDPWGNQQTASQWGNPVAGPAGAAMKPAGWWNRLFGYIADNFILGIVTLPAVLIGVVLLDGVASGQKDPVTGKVAISSVDVPQLMFGLLIASSMYLAIFFGYQVFTQVRRGISHSGETLGKQIVSVRVVKQNGSPVDTRAVLMRELVGKTLAYGLVLAVLEILTFAVFPLFGFLTFGWFVWWWILCPLLDDQNRCPHDKIAGTRPVESSYVPAS